MAIIEFDEEGVRLVRGTEDALPPLIRGAIEASLYEFGVEDPEVQADGRVFEHPNGEREPLTDLAFIVQAAVGADLAIEALTGQRCAFGREFVKRLAHVGRIERAESFYKERRRTLHEIVTPLMLAEALKRARRIVNKDAYRAKRRGG